MGQLANPGIGQSDEARDAAGRRASKHASSILARSRAMAIAEHDSVCTLDCPDTCALTVTVEDDRIVKVRGSDRLAYTGGVICNKVAHHTGEFVHGDGRILHPMRRSGPRGDNRFTRITWDEALDEIHARTSAVIE